MTVAATSLDSRVEAAIQWAISIANDNSHGYSQANRNGPDYDCSSFVSTAFKNGGFSVSGSLNTSSMKSAFEKVGFTSYKKGDVTITQKELAAKTGIAQGDISKLENGSANPSLKTLQRLAAGMGMRLKLEFVPCNR